jgi:ribosome-associated protein
MPTRKITTDLLASEFVYITSRSGGPGGQNVNKVNSKVTLQFDVRKSDILSEDEKNTILEKISSWLTREGVLIVSSQQSRSQIQNKEAVIQKFDDLLEKAFKKKKLRKATRPSKGSVQERIKKKKVHGEKKKWRRKPGAEG